MSARARPRAPVGHDTAWRLHAKCRDSNPGRFYPDRGDAATVNQAKAVCATCPVRGDCLLAGLDGMELGIWGGAGDPTRRVLRAQPRVHRGYDETCGCAFCSAASKHFARLDGQQVDEPVTSFGPGARHAKASTYARGRRCTPCGLAKQAQTLVALCRTQARAS